MTSKSLEIFRGIRSLPRGVIFGRLAYLLKNPFFRLTLSSSNIFASKISVLAHNPPDPWPGQADRGAAIIQNRFTLADQTIENPEPLWTPREAGADFFATLHDFSWLRDLRASGGDQARRRARELTESWIDQFGKWNGRTWEPDITGRRLANWLGQYEFFAASAEITFRQTLIQSAERQALHLFRVLPAGLYGAELVATLKGLIFAGVALPGASDLRERGLTLLKRELARQLLADGGHIERCPARQMSVLRDLMDIRATLSAANGPGAPFLETAISSMAPVLRLFQHGDGKLALFNGTNEGDSLHIDLILQRCPGPKKPLMTAPESGFQRLQSGRSVVIADAGAPPPPAYDRDAHAGTGSFEFSIGRERIIVNCGAQEGSNELNLAQRSTAAHSTLTLEARNSSQVDKKGGLGSRPDQIYARCIENEDGDHLLEMTQDGYYERLGALHHRSLYLSAAGDDLRGEDRLEYPMGGGGGQRFAIRFHLHPDVKALVSLDGKAVLLSMRKAGGWRLRAEGAALSLEPSIYLGEPGNIRRTQQIVLSGNVAGSEALVKWAFRKESKS